MNHKGSEGVVKVGTDTIAELKMWNMAESANMIDDTELGDDWKTKKPGTNEWSGSVDCFYDPSDSDGQGALVAGAEVTLNLYATGEDAGDMFFTGTAIISSITRTGAIDAMIEVSFNFEGTGPLALTTLS